MGTQTSLGKGKPLYHRLQSVKEGIELNRTNVQQPWAFQRAGLQVTRYLSLLRVVSHNSR